MGCLFVLYRFITLGQFVTVPSERDFWLFNVPGGTKLGLQTTLLCVMKVAEYSKGVKHGHQSYAVAKAKKWFKLESAH